MTATLSLEEQEVLLSVYEHSPLWEIAASFADRSGEQDRESVHERVAEILQDFGSRGWLELSQRRVTDSDTLGPLTPVPLADLGDVLANPENWRVATDAGQEKFDYFIFSPTVAAEAVIQSGGVDDVWPHA